jgi:hypothetical protein
MEQKNILQTYCRLQKYKLTLLPPHVLTKVNQLLLSTVSKHDLYAQKEDTGRSKNIGNYIQSYSITLVKVIKFIFNLYTNYINNKIYEKQKDSKIINS